MTQMNSFCALLCIKKVSHFGALASGIVSKEAMPHQNIFLNHDGLGTVLAYHLECHSATSGLFMSSTDRHDNQQSLVPRTDPTDCHAGIRLIPPKSPLHAWGWSTPMTLLKSCEIPVSATLQSGSKYGAPGMPTKRIV